MHDIAGHQSSLAGAEPEANRWACRAGGIRMGFIDSRMGIWNPAIPIATSVVGRRGAA